MNYHIEIDGESLELELIERAGELYVVHPDVADGEPTRVELSAVRKSGSYSLLVGNRQLPIVVSGPNDDLTLTVATETWHCSVLDQRESLARAAEGGGGARAGGGLLRSVMPGIVRELRVEAGDQVERGQPLLILEAMKMENEIRADADGVISVVHVTAGTAVAKGDPLLTLE